MAWKRWGAGFRRTSGPASLAARQRWVLVRGGPDFPCLLLGFKAARRWMGGRVGDSRVARWRRREGARRGTRPGPADRPCRAGQDHRRGRLAGTAVGGSGARSSLQASSVIISLARHCLAGCREVDTVGAQQVVALVERVVPHVDHNSPVVCRQAASDVIELANPVMPIRNRRNDVRLPQRERCQLSPGSRCDLVHAPQGPRSISSKAGSRRMMSLAPHGRWSRSGANAGTRSI